MYFQSANLQIIKSTNVLPQITQIKKYLSQFIPYSNQQIDKLPNHQNVNFIVYF
jgi:hypothetical protein